MELRRRRGVATYLQFPIVDADGDPVSGLSAWSIRHSTWSDTVAPTVLGNVLNGVAENSAGLYYASLTAGEMAADYLYVIASPTSGSGKAQHLLIVCTAIASVTEVTTTTGVTSSVAIDWNRVINPTSTVGLSGTTVATATGVTSSVAPDWGRVANPTTALNLSSTTIASVTRVASVSSAVSVSTVSSAVTVASITVGISVATVTPAITVGTNLDKTSYTIAVGGFPVGGYAAGAITAAAMDTDASVEIADTIMDYNLASATDVGTEGYRTVLQSLRMLRNRVVVGDTGVVTVYKEDDATASWTGAVGTTSDAAHINSVNPT